MKNESMMPPVAEETEQGIVGSMVVDFQHHGHLVIDMLEPDDFYMPIPREIYRAIYEMHEQEKPIDIIAVEQYLKEKPKLWFDPARETREITRFCVYGNIEYHALIVKQYSLRRRFIQNQTANVRKGYDLQEDIFELIDQAQQQLMDAASGLLHNNGVALRDAVPAVVKALKAREETHGLTGVPSQLEELDALTGGWQNSDLIILAARPSMGKTAAALKFMIEAAQAGGTPGIMSLEMSTQQLIERLLSSETGLNQRAMKQGGLSDAQKNALDAAGVRLAGYNMLIHDEAGLNVQQVRSIARRWQREHGLDFLVVDYLQLLAGKNRGGMQMNREQEISQISRELKKLAKELNIPVLALSQLSRAVETRPDKRPQLSDLRESGSLEQDSDVVIFMYRPEYYQIKEDALGRDTNGLVEFLIKKQRNGPIGTASSYFDKENGRFNAVGGAPQDGSAPPPPPPEEFYDDVPAF